MEFTSAISTYFVSCLGTQARGDKGGEGKSKRAEK